MKFSYTARLFGRNAVATFTKGFTAVNDADYGVWPLALGGLILHLTVLPVSLTVGAGLKTAWDAMTRNHLSKGEISKLVNDIDDMDTETFAIMIKEIVDDYRDERASSSNSSNRLFRSFTRTDNPTLYLKELVKNYIQAEHNNGKKLLNIICRKTSEYKSSPTPVSNPLEVKPWDGCIYENNEVMQERFIKAVKKQIERLEKNGQSMFGIGNYKKAAAIKSALEDFEMEPILSKQLLVEDALNIQRLSLTNTRPAKSTQSRLEAGKETGQVRLTCNLHAFDYI